MNETNGFAGPAALEEAAAGRRRFKEVEIPLLGVVRLRSITALEYVSIEAALTRAGMAGRNNRPQQHKNLLADAYADLLLLMWCDGEGNPALTESHKPLLKKLDSATSQALASACLKHAGLDEDDFEELAKNSARATGGDSPTGSLATSAGST